jgi:acyl-CoA thioester hydrolase
MDRQPPPVRADFAVFRGVGTRWADNDMYGHLNNAVYYQLFDTAINTWIIERARVAPADSTCLAVTVQNGCQFHRELFFPQQLEVGLRVARIGRSSVTYHLGLFVAESEAAAATGHWVHVYVDREKRSVVPIPQAIRDAYVELR